MGKEGVVMYWNWPKTKTNNKIKVLPNRHDLYKVFLRKNKVGAEIGVAQGKNAVDILQYARPDKLHLVDPWNWDGYLHIYGGVTPQVDKNRQEIEEYRSTFTDWKSYVEDVFEEEIQSNKVELHQLTGQDWLKQQEDNSLDFVYCDALKHPGEIESFLNESMRVLRKDGLFCGHDYFNHGQTRSLAYNVHVPILDAIQDGQIRLLGLSTDVHLPPSFVCRVNK